MNRSRNRSTYGFSLGSLGSSFGIGLHSFGLGHSGYNLGGGYRSSNPYSSSYRGYLSGKGQSAYDDRQSVSKSYSRYESPNYYEPQTRGGTLNRYTGANVEEELTHGRPLYEPSTDSTKQHHAWLRNKSSDVISSVLNRFKDQRSVSRADRDPLTLTDRRQSYADTSSSFDNRDSSVSRDSYRDREQSYTPARRLGSVGPGVDRDDQVPLPPPRFRKSNSSHYGSTTSISARNEDASKQSLSSQPVFYRTLVTRSQSLHDLSSQDTLRPPRRQTLTSGISQLDLQKARQTFPESSHNLGSYSAINISSRSLHTQRQLSPPNRSSSLSRSLRDLGYASQPTSRRESNSNISHGEEAAVDVEYKKLWEESVAENLELREDMKNIKEELAITRAKLQIILKNQSCLIVEKEQMQKKTMEKRLKEMEKEIKELQELKIENERLKTENHTLSEMVSKTD